jgi:hypothetical protein
MSPELNLARTHAIDYFDSLPGVPLFGFESSKETVTNACDEHTLSYLKALGSDLGYVVGVAGILPEPC